LTVGSSIQAIALLFSLSLLEQADAFAGAITFASVTPNINNGAPTFVKSLNSTFQNVSSDSKKFPDLAISLDISTSFTLGNVVV
jgi:hypothetical protein